MGIEKAGLNLGKEIIAWARSGGKSMLATKPVKVNIEGLKLAPQLQNDTFVKMSNNIDEFIKADKKLFSWVKGKHALPMDEVIPENLVLVHRTKYFPEDGKILSTSAVTKNAEGVSEYRPTIHFSLNKSVTEHFVGNAWDTMQYSILLPFKKTVESMPKSKVLGGIQDDFMFMDSVKLPKGSVILKHNTNIPKDQFKISEVFDGVKLIETSTDDMVKTTDLVIEKMGYTPYRKALQKHLGATNAEMEVLNSIPETEFIKNSDEISGQINVTREQIKKTLESLKESKYLYDSNKYKELIKQYKQGFKMCDLIEKSGTKIHDFPNAWSKFCKEYNYYEGLHQGSVWGNSEMFFAGLGAMVKGNKNSWVWDGTDCKALFLEALDFIKNKLTLDKDLGFDINEVISIIKRSKTPELAQKEIAQKIKFKPMKITEETKHLRIERLKKLGFDDNMIADFNASKDDITDFDLQMILDLII